MGFPGGSAVKKPSARQEIWVQILGGKEPLEKDLATHFGILAWEISWTEESRGLQRVGHDLEKAMAPHSSTLAWKIPRVEEPGRLQSMGSLRVGHDWATSLSIFTFHFHALKKEMATHSSVLAWRIPGTGEPGGLSSLGSHRVGHDWSDLAAAAGHDLVTKQQQHSWYTSFNKDLLQIKEILFLPFSLLS